MFYLGFIFNILINIIVIHDSCNITISSSTKNLTCEQYIGQNIYCQEYYRDCLMDIIFFCGYYIKCKSDCIYLSFAIGVFEQVTIN